MFCHIAHSIHVYCQRFEPPPRRVCPVLTAGQHHKQPRESTPESQGCSDMHENLPELLHNPPNTSVSHAWMQPFRKTMAILSPHRYPNQIKLL